MTKNYMKNYKLFTFAVLIFLIVPNKNFSQSYEDYLDPFWVDYYKRNPSGIESHFKAIDFIKVIDHVNFIPTKKEYQGDPNIFKIILLSADFQVLRQMMISGIFYSQSKKHDDYFYLYNIFYPKIEKIHGIDMHLT
jgi:hypothetical protein